ncbi:MAG: nitrilase-related carbon-nitrogen hydrolase, partial [Pseudomonadota bacterium]
ATGFTMAPQDAAEPLDGSSVSWMRALAERHDSAVCGSLSLREGDAFVNRFVFVHPDGRMDYYDKRHLFAMAGEDRVYRRGTERVVIHFRGWRIVPQICYDLRFPVWHRFAQGCDLMLFVANWPAPRIDAWRTLLKARAIENQCFVAGVNRVGRDQNDKRYCGASALYGPGGETLLQAGDVTTALTATVDPSVLTAHRERLPFYRDADAFEIT